MLRGRLQTRGARGLLGAAALASTLASREARAADDQKPALPPPRAAATEVEPPTKPVGETPETEHNEFAGAPILGGNTDIGFQIGVAATFTRASPRYIPYRWKIDGLVSASVKDGPRGTEVVQQSHDMRLDIPRAVYGKLRIMPGIFFERTVNAGYFGVGNAAPAITNPDGTVGSRYQYVHREIRARVNLRQPLGGAHSVMYGLALRNVSPSSYAGSKLDLDSRRVDAQGQPYIRGLESLNHAVVSGGLVYDTRDNEITPHRGSFDNYALRLSGATPVRAGVYSGGANIIVRRYVPIAGPFVFAARGFVDAMVGNVPFYDLSQGGAFIPIDLPGGAQGVRGVPNGRYSGLVKVVANVEVRVTHLRFRMFGDDFRVGNNVFFDAGRVFAKYGRDPRDGTGLGLKYGVGVGVFVVWGTAAVFRVEFAYSPDAVAANPNFPIGIYAADGQMF
ncbi:MAG: BamA/TamA family outer membrane protein [Labilithrix sp.]|nr:BamA/TamA family outer membrane protein [Labilithrix sp.]MCW5837729.1 BamA/TamA family outer membrane protein [Labilithrix sp.]